MLGTGSQDVRRRTVAALAALVTALAVGGLAPVPSQAATEPASASVTGPAPVTTPGPRRIVTGWGYFGSPSSSALTSLQANADLFTDVSPFWYTATGDSTSSSVEPTSFAADRSRVLPLIRATGIRVLPTISDGMDPLGMATILASGTTRDALVDQIVATASAYDGIDLDFESFAFHDGQASWTATRPLWVAFVTQLSAALHAEHKLLSVTTPPMYSATTGYWVYDWAGISAAVDRLRVMTYDYSVSTAGPISPYSWVSSVAAFAVTQVAAAKVQIGVPAYGRDWVTSTSYSGVTSACPATPPAGSTSEQRATFASTMAWTQQRHTYTSAEAAGYLARFSGTGFAVPGITVLTKPVATWQSTYRERTFSSRVSFAGTRPQQVVTTGTADAGSTAVTVASTEGLVAGLTVTGAGIAAGTTVASIAAATKVVTLSAPTTAAIADEALTFAGPVPATCTINRTGFYDDASATLARAGLVGRYHLAGIAQWTIGGEDPVQWSRLRTYAASIAPTPTVVSMSAPVRTVYGRSVSVVVAASSAGLPVTATSASLYFRRNGSTVFSLLSSSALSPTGHTTFTPVVTAGGTFRAVVPGTFDRASGSVLKAIALQTAVLVTAPTTAVPPASRVAVVARAQPRHAGQRSALQVRRSGAWVTLLSTKTDIWGRAFYAVRSPAKGVTVQYRVAAYGYPGVLGNYGFFSVHSA